MGVLLMLPAPVQLLRSAPQGSSFAGRDLELEGTLDACLTVVGLRSSPCSIVACAGVENQRRPWMRGLPLLTHALRTGSGYVCLDLESERAGNVCLACAGQAHAVAEADVSRSLATFLAREGAVAGCKVRVAWLRC
jgi:hypothetical protein